MGYCNSFVICVFVDLGLLAWFGLRCFVGGVVWVEVWFLLVGDYLVLVC